MKIVINSIPVVEMVKTIDIVKMMQHYNHTFDYHVRNFPELRVFNLEINSKSLTIHCDEYKVIVSDIIPEIKINYTLDDIESINII